MKKLFLIIIVILFIQPVYSYNIDTIELRKIKKVKFNNWRGRYNRIIPRWKQRRVGRRIAARTMYRGNRPVNYLSFRLIRATSKDKSKKLSADIFVIRRHSNILHINYIRRVITGYLMKMYGYEMKDAQTLAFYITYYNAVYRGKLKYFSSIYKPIVMKHLRSYNAGISVNYYNWPGRTRIVIPLTKDAKRGKLDAIDPDIISDKKIKDKIRKDDKNIKKRKDLIDLKKKIIDRDKDDVKKKKDDIKKKEDKLKDDKKKLKDKEDKIKKEKDKVKDIKDPKKKEEKKEEIKKEEKKVKREKDKIKKEEDTIKEDKDKVKKQEEDVKKREEDVKKDEKNVRDDEIKRDIDKNPDDARDKLKKKDEDLKKREKDLDTREDKLKDKIKDKKVFANKFYYLKIKEYLEGGHYNNELYMIDAAKRKVLFKSSVKNISGRRYDIYSKGIVVITRPNKDKLKHVLTMIDRKTLHAITSGKANVFWRSFVEIKDGSIYAIVVKNNKYYLGKFDGELKLELVSKAEITSNTFITFYEKLIYINSVNKKILVLKKDDLSKVDVIQP